jgi:polysaccharide deacetylase 2 family uncharacterized protein YibQ
MAENSRKSPLYWVLLVLCALFVALLSFMVFMYYQGVDKARDSANQSVQRMVYDVASKKFLELIPSLEKDPKTKQESEIAHPKSVEDESPDSLHNGGDENKDGVSPNLPKIAIVITGLGLSKSTTSQILKLPPEVSAAVSPYSHFSGELTAKFKDEGRVVLIDMPMEPDDFPISDAGPYALLNKDKLVQNLANIDWAINRIPSAVGIISPMNEQFTKSDNFEKVIENLHNNKLMAFTIDRRAKGAIQANIVIDSVINENDIAAKLQELEAIALDKGFAIGIARPYPISITAINGWSATLAGKGIMLAPISAINIEVVQNKSLDKKSSAESGEPSAH